ncbi:MAG: protease inhibitor I42 family protein [Archangiaceae bacterium]|nr:protease inhibitor I42 family protein [Archangiaceae bacterium]
MAQKKQAAAKAAAKPKSDAKAKAKVKQIAAPKKSPPKKVEAKEKGKKAKGKDAIPAPTLSAPTRREGAFLGPMPDKPLPRASKLPGLGEPLTKREMEQLLTVGTGRGVMGEGSLKGRLIVHANFPYLEVIGRDKRELYFLLQGPDQEVLPAYVDHKVSVSGFIHRTNNHGGMVEVRKYSAKKPDAEVEIEPPTPPEDKLRYLSPGDVEQVSSAGMGSGMKGYASLRGTLEMTGEDFFLVVSNAGTRQQVSFLLEGKGAKGLRKNVGHVLHVTGVVEKSSGWGGKIICETCEPRPTEFKAVSRDNMDVVEIEGSGQGGKTEVKQNNGLSVRLPERAGYTWAVEPTTAKRVGLREANFELKSSGATREFFFTPRNPGDHEVEFFLAKAFNPAQVTKTYKLALHVKGLELMGQPSGGFP